MTKETLEKYKAVEREFEKFREEAERKIDDEEKRCRKLEKENS